MAPLREHARSIWQAAVDAVRPYLERKYRTYVSWGQHRVLPAGDDMTVAYDELMTSGSRSPIKDLTKRLAEQGQPQAEATVRDWVHDARDRGYLSGPRQQGRPGGQATKLARELAARPPGPERRAKARP